MLGCIWSCPTDQMLKFPVATMIRFCHNHGLIQVANRPQWWTVTGGARNYVEKILAGIARQAPEHPRAPHRARRRWRARVTDQGTEHFDQVVLATHSDQSLALLAQPTAQEREVLGAIRYQPNRAVLHTDTSVLPAAPRRLGRLELRARPRPTARARESARVCLHYLLNQLQPLPFAQPVVVSLNPVRDMQPAPGHWQYEYAHPVFDWAPSARSSRWALQGQHTPGSAAPGRATASMKTAQVRPGRGAPTGWQLLQAPLGWPHDHEPPPRPPSPCSALARCATRGCGRKARVCLPTFFLMLPMRSWRTQRHGALAVNRRGAISFHDVDHGDGRSAEQGGALAWLDELLRTEGIHDATGEVWLHCYPRVLGYTFKPVSFWYCHRADGSLRAIVVEVNNTFGERHCYLLDAPQYGVEQQARKVFHVSPFCEVSGRLPLSLHAHARQPPTQAAPWCALTTTTTRPADPDQRERHPARHHRPAPCAGAVGLPRHDAGRGGPHPLAALRCGSSACGFIASPRPRLHRDPLTSPPAPTCETLP
jgi:hypothetical protein